MAEESLSAEEIENIRESFNAIDLDSSGYIDSGELRSIFEENGYCVPAYQCRELVKNFDKDGNLKIDIEEAVKLFAVIKKQFKVDFTKHIKRKSGIKTHGGMTEASAEGTTHSISKQEEIAFSNWIDRNLAHDPDATGYLPIDEVNGGLYKNIRDGIVLCKVINVSSSESIDERAINKGKNLSVFKKRENLILALTSAAAIGCNIVNIGAEDLEKGKPHLVLGLLWQIIKICLLSEINLQGNPNLATLLKEGESMDDLKSLTPEQLLLRWVNYHLAKTSSLEIHNFSGDIMDSQAYCILLNEIAPKDTGVTLFPLEESDLPTRAEKMLCEAEKLDCRQFVSAHDVVKGNPKLNFAFVANLFNHFPALEKAEHTEDIVQETREMKTFRNWLNSTPAPDSPKYQEICRTKKPPPKVPYINNLLCDLCDGIRILQMLDYIKPGIVHWPHVNFPPYKQLNKLMKVLENCSMCVDLGKSETGFSLVGIDGKNLLDHDETPTLSIVWQLMRAYTLVILTKLSHSDKPVTEETIITWANDKLSKSPNKRSFKNFKDDRLKTSLIIIDLIEEIRRNAADMKHVILNPTSEADRLLNAKYAISIARRIGARIYALPEDITEVNSKMILTIFACLMAVDFQNQGQNAKKDDNGAD